MNKTTKPVAITLTKAGGLDQVVDPRFGRAPVFLFVDPVREEVLAEQTNDAVQAAHGAGTSAAAAVADRGASDVISGRFGPKAAEALRALGVRMWVAPPDLDAREALRRFRDGSLEPMVVREYR